MNSYIEKRDKLPEPMREFIMADWSQYELEKVCFMYDLHESEIKIVTFPIALIFIGDIALKDYPMLLAKELDYPENIIYGIAFEVNKRSFVPFSEHFTDAQMLLDEWSKKRALPVLSESEAWEKVLEFEPEIKEREKEQEEQEKKANKVSISIGSNEFNQAHLEEMSIEEALRKYPSIGEQLITPSHIKIKMFPEPVRPSINNWLSDYTFTVGISNHDPIIRGNYLFKSENAINLETKDREKLGLILKSFEEKMPLSVNPNAKQVIFDTPQKQNYLQTAPHQNSARTGTSDNFFQTIKPTHNEFESSENATYAKQKSDPVNIHFSSSQKFQIETGTDQSQPSTKTPRVISHNYPAINNTPKTLTKKTRPISKNVVDLREK